jgi:hypothetical protein
MKDARFCDVTNDTVYCDFINDTVYCNGICSECGNSQATSEDDED